MRGLSDKIALITGGLGDLGYATAQRLSEEGCKIILADMRPDSMGKANLINAFFIQVDISKEAEVKKACDEIAARVGNVHILVNTAAYFVFKGVEATEEDWTKINAVNIGGTSLITKYIVPQMRSIGGNSKRS